MPILAELQGGPEDYRLRNPMSVLGMLVEVECKSSAHLGESGVWKKSQDRFVQKKLRISLLILELLELDGSLLLGGFSDPVGGNGPLDMGCLDFWKARSLTKGS